MRRTMAFLVASLVVAGTAAAQEPIITTVAGKGAASFCGDGGPATAACLRRPSNVALDGTDQLFIVDTTNHRVRKVDVNGTITTVAGSGPTGDSGGGYCGDGGPATSACLHLTGARYDVHSGIAFDGVGNLLIADTLNGRIRRVDLAGTISTVAGRGPDTGQTCGDGGPATSACLRQPNDIAVDAVGNLFITSAAAVRVRKVDAATGIITTVAGGRNGYCGDGGPATSACLSWPMDIAVDGVGNLYIGDSTRVRKVDVAGTITTVAGGGTAWPGDGGPATEASLGGLVSGVAVDAEGNLLITAANRVRRVDAAGVITTLAGNGTWAVCGDWGPAASACLSATGVASESTGAVLVADLANHRVRRVALGPARDGLASLVLSPATTAGCLAVRGKLTLTAPAPGGGITVLLESDDPAALVPASVFIKAGSRSKVFSVDTRPVATRQVASIEARAYDRVASGTLTLKPIAPKSVALTPNPVVGGTAVSGTVTLECPAGPGDIEVRMTSTKPLVAAPTTSSITVPVGTKVMPFTVTTNPVTVVTKPAIKATANGVTKSKALVVNPAP